MGNGNICVNTKDYLNDRKFTLQYPSHSKEEQKLFPNNYTIDCYNNTNGNKNIIYPNYYNNSNFITINSRKWFKAAPKKNNNADSPYTNMNFSIKEQSLYSEASQHEYNNNINNNNFVFLPFGDKYEGDIYNNKPHGKGKYYSATGEIREGTFINGQLSGKGKMNLCNGITLDYKR